MGPHPGPHSRWVQVPLELHGLGWHSPTRSPLYPVLITGARRDPRFAGKGVMGLETVPRLKAEMQMTLQRPQEETLGQMLRGWEP